MEAFLKLAAAVAAAITAGIKMFRNTKPKQDNVAIETQSGINVRQDTTIHLAITNRSDQQLIVTDIRPKKRKDKIHFGPCNQKAQSLESYAESLRSVTKTGIDRFFPPRINPGETTFGYIVLDGTHPTTELMFMVQKADSRRTLKVVHLASIAPPLAAFQIVSNDNHFD